MENWIPKPPTSPRLGDHDVPALGTRLTGQRIALLVCGGIAAMRAPSLARALRRHGADVVAYITDEARRYVGVDALEWATCHPVVTALTARSEHLSDAEPFDVFLAAPATYNTINKFRLGVADTPVTTAFAAALGRLERGLCQVVVAPTMHGDMHNSILQESLESLRAKGAHLIPPRDAYGKHNIPDSETIVAHVAAATSRSPLKGVRILLTAGATPTPIDNVRCITNRFRGRLGVEIARELVFRGADLKMIMGAGSVPWPTFLKVDVAVDFDAYLACVVQELKIRPPTLGVFSAAVADYAPTKRLPGKTPSDGSLKTIDLTPTPKVIDLAQAAAPQMKLISFKYQENISLTHLFEIAQDRLERGHVAVVANRGEDASPDGDQIAYLVTRGAEPQQMVTKRGIAHDLCDHLESLI